MPTKYTDKINKILSYNTTAFKQTDFVFFFIINKRNYLL